MQIKNFKKWCIKLILVIGILSLFNYFYYSELPYVIKDILSESEIFNSEEFIKLLVSMFVAFINLMEFFILIFFDNNKIFIPIDFISTSNVDNYEDNNQSLPAGINYSDNINSNNNNTNDQTNNDAQINSSSQSQLSTEQEETVNELAESISDTLYDNAMNLLESQLQSMYETGPLTVRTNAFTNETVIVTEEVLQEVRNNISVPVPANDDSSVVRFIISRDYIGNVRCFTLPEDHNMILEEESDSDDNMDTNDSNDGVEVFYDEGGRVYYSDSKIKTDN